MEVTRRTYGRAFLIGIGLCGSLFMASLVLTSCGSSTAESLAVQTAASPVPDNVEPATPPAPPVSPEPDPAARLFASGFEAPVTIASNDSEGNVIQQVQGSDVATFEWRDSLWGEPQGEDIGIQSIVGEAAPLPAASYCSVDILDVTGRTGAPTRALSLANIGVSPATSVQQIALRRIDMADEPVFYQRMWVKFDVDTLRRAVAAGDRDFYQIFWEVKAEPDFRMRLQLQYDARDGLYWQTQADTLASSDALWSSTLNTVPVVLAPHDAAQGWHKVEVWMDRPGNRFRAAIDDAVLADHRGPLMGSSGNRIDVMLMMIVYSSVAPLAGVLFDDLEVWSAPPSELWR